MCFFDPKILILVDKNLLIFKSRENVSYFYPTVLLALLALLCYQICQYLSIFIMFFHKRKSEWLDGRESVFLILFTIECPAI